MYGTAKTHWTPFLPQLLPNPQPRPSLPLVPPHANADTFRHPANEIAIPPIHLSPPSRNSSPPSLPHLRPIYPPLLLPAKSRWVLAPPRPRTTSTYPTRASITSTWTLKVNNTTAAQTVQPRALILMVTAGQWQAVKNTLSRPNGRSLTTSDTMVFQQQVQLFDTTYPTLPFLLIQNLIWYHTLIDIINYYVTIFLLIQQATTCLYSHWYNWYSKLLNDYTPIEYSKPLLCPIPLLIQHYYATQTLWYSKLLRYHSHDTTI